MWTIQSNDNVYVWLNSYILTTSINLCLKIPSTMINYHLILITVPCSPAALGCAVATFDNLKEAKLD